MGEDINGGWNWSGEDAPSFGLTEGPVTGTLELNSSPLGKTAEITGKYSHGAVTIIGTGIVDQSGFVSRERIKEASIEFGEGDKVSVRVGIGAERAFGAISVLGKDFPVQVTAGQVRRELADIFDLVPDVLKPVGFEEDLNNIAAKLESAMAELRDYGPELLSDDMQRLYNAAAALKGWPINPTFDQDGLTDINFDNTPSDPSGPILYIGDGSGRGEHESPFGSIGGSTGALGGLTGGHGGERDIDTGESGGRSGLGPADSGDIGGNSLSDGVGSVGLEGPRSGGSVGNTGGSIYGGVGTDVLGDGPMGDDLGGSMGGGGFPGKEEDDKAGFDLDDDGVDVSFPGKEEDDKAGFELDDDGPEVEVDPSLPMSPILLDLDGNGIQITELSQSTVFMDAGDDGFEHRTAWAGQGDGVLFYDVGNDGKIEETREYVFTEWDPTARSDFEALRARFDSNNDGKLTSADAEFSKFRVMVTKADGTLEAQTLTQLGITSIDLTGDTTDIRLPDGSVITGQSTFTMCGVERTAADVTLMAEAA